MGPSLIAESTGIEPDPDINRTHCLAGNRYHHQALLSIIFGYLIGFEPILSVPQTDVLTVNTIDTIFKIHL